MTRSRVLITTSYLRPGDEVDRLLVEAGFEVVHSSMKDRKLSGHKLAELVARADAVIAGTDPFSAEVIVNAERLKVIARTGVGYDNIDLEAVARRGIVLCTTRGANRVAVAEHAVALMLSLARSIPQNLDAVKSGVWEQPSGRELHGATLGVIGLGSIGQSVSTTAQALGMRVIGYDPFADQSVFGGNGVTKRSLEEVLRESDFVSLHISLSNSTRHLIDSNALAVMKPSAFLINTSRGGVVDEKALMEALEAKELAGAALDVAESEPVPAASPLLQVRNLIITSHIAGATVEARSNSSLAAARNVITFFAGLPVTNQVQLLPSRTPSSTTN